jgi:hypothetical protein
MAMTSGLTQTLLMISEAAAQAEDPWWIIGSAAVALHGADVPDVRDVDLLMSVRDANRTLRGLGSEERAGEPSSQFRSDVFGVWQAPPVPVEIMGGFRLATESGWVAVSPATRRAIMVDGRALFVPSAVELGEILISFGRPKDLERLRLLTLAIE